MWWFLLMGITAGMLTFIEYIVYVLAIWGKDYRFQMIPHSTIPNRATWFLWFVVGIVAASSYAGVGATDTWWFALANAVGFGIIFLLSVPFGEGGDSFLDTVVMILAALVFILWLKFQTMPAVPLVAALAIETCAATPTIVKAWARPETESRGAWTASVLASVTLLLAVENWYDPIRILHETLAAADWRSFTFWITLLQRPEFWIPVFPVWILILVSLITMPLYVRRVR